MRRTSDRHPRSVSRVAKFAAVAMLTVLLGTITGAAAYAATGLYTVRGPWLAMSYQDRSSVVKSGSSLITTEDVTRSPYGGNVNAGYAGAQPRVMNSNGTVCAAGSMTYNPSTTVAYAVQISQHCGIGAEYYAYGLARYWTGSNYAGNYYSSPSPRVNF